MDREATMQREIRRLRSIVRKHHRALCLIEETIPKMKREVFKAYTLCRFEGNQVSLQSVILDAIEYDPTML